MKVIENWENVEAKGMEDFKSLPIGAYECIIREAKVYKNPTTEKESFRVQEIFSISRRQRKLFQRIYYLR